MPQSGIIVGILITDITEYCLLQAAWLVDWQAGRLTDSTENDGGWK